MRRLTVLAVALTFLTVASRAAPAGDEPKEIRWDKRQDAFQTPNRAGAALESRRGTCNGDVELEFAWAAAREQDPSLPPLAEVEKEILGRTGPTGGAEYLQKVRELAQRHSYRAGGGGVRIDAPAGKPRPADETLAEAKAAVERGEPTRLLLTGTQREIDRNGQVVERKVLHTVTAYQAAEADGTVGLRVADSSAPGRSGMLVIDDKTGGRKGWEEVTEGDLGKVRWDRVDRITNPPGDPKVYKELLDAARRGVPASAIESGLGLDRVPPPKTSAVISDPKAGGVWIAFDPAAFSDDPDSEVSEATIDEWVARTQAFLDSGDGAGLALSTEDTTRSVRLVSLAKVLDSGAATLAPLTRVNGYVVTAAGDVLLAGTSEEGREPIPLDWLTVALRTVWRNGQAPFVSLDPDPKNLTGPPKPRSGDVPAGFADSAFIRILFAADYAMKEIVLGAKPLPVEGYRSLRSLLAERRPTTVDVVARMWLTPLSAPVADVLETRRGADTAVWFQSRVQVLTEEMLAGAAGLTGTGRANPFFAEAAALFTKHYDAIAEEVPVFRRLQALFDLAKASAILKARGIRAPVLDRVADRVPASGEEPPDDEPKAPFPGVGILPVDGTDIVLSGGARAKARVKTKGVVATDRLSPLLDAAASGAGGPVEISFPAVLDLDAAAVLGADAELSFSTAVAQLRGGDAARAAEGFTRVLDADPDDADAWMLRGLARLQAQEVADGRADLDRAVALAPKHAAIRAIVRVTEGERAEALADADAAERAAPEDEQTLVLCGLARVRSLDFAGAQSDLVRLRALAPGHPALDTLENELDLWRSLPKERAEARLRQIRDLPQDVQRLLVTGGSLIEPDPKGAMAVLRQALSLAESSPVEAVRTLAVPERIRFLIGLAAWQTIPKPAFLYEKTFVEEGAAPAREEAKALVAAHPDWPSGYVLLACVAAAADSVEEAALAYGMAADRARNRDPIFDDMAPQWGASSMVAMLGTSVVWGLWERDLSPSSVLERVTTVHGDGPTSRALDVLRRNPELNVARFLRDRSRGEGGTKEALQKTLAVLRECEAALDGSRASDAVDQWFLQIFFKAYLPLEQEVGEDYERLLSASVKYLRATDGVEPKKMLSEPIYALRSAAYGMAAAAVTGGAMADLRTRMETTFRGLDEAIQKRDGAAVREALGAMARGVRTEFPGLKRRIAERLDRVGKACGPRARDAVLLQIVAFENQFRRVTGSEREFERLEAVPGVAGSSELAEYRKALEDAKRGGILVDDDARVVLGRVLSVPGDAVEAQTLLRFLPMVEGMTQGLFPDQPPPVDFAEAARILKVRIRLAAYADPAAAPSARHAESRRDTSPEEGGFPVLLVAGIALVVLGALLLLLRARRR